MFGNRVFYRGIGRGHFWVNICGFFLDICVFFVGIRSRVCCCGSFRRFMAGRR
jgi:hypothetical protein